MEYFYFMEKANFVFAIFWRRRDNPNLWICSGGVNTHLALFQNIISILSRNCGKLTKGRNSLTCLRNQLRNLPKFLQFFMNKCYEKLEIGNKVGFFLSLKLINNKTLFKISRIVMKTVFIINRGNE